MLANERHHVRRLCDAGKFGLEDEPGYARGRNDGRHVKGLRIENE
jgi:hypothetical protein